MMPNGELLNHIAHTIDKYNEDTNTYIITSTVTYSKSMVIDKRVLDVLTVGQSNKLYRKLDDLIVKDVVCMSKPFMKENTNKC